MNNIKKNIFKKVFFKLYQSFLLNIIILQLKLTYTSAFPSLSKPKYSGRHLMGSWIMESIGLWDHFYPEGKVPNFYSILNFTLILI
jgi:hypothetical protein